jgi:hypothetical protein
MRTTVLLDNSVFNFVKVLQGHGAEGPIPFKFIATTEGFPETRMPTIPTPIQHSTGIPSQSNQARRRNKRNTDR